MNIKEIAKRSLMHCHVHGVHSVVLSPEGRAMDRLFYASPEHELHHNIPGGNMSVAFHPHHCDIKIRPIFGSIFHWIVQESFSPDGGNLWMNKFEYQSAIKGRSCAFRSLGKYYLQTISQEWMSRGTEIDLSAKAAHTVGAERRKTAAWYVFEGQEDDRYKAICYSNSKLENHDASGLYQPMPEDYCEFILRRCGLYPGFWSRPYPLHWT